ncbi:unnamed protein product [Protopolystoma xenopodis]|uniref:Uncharacterized protein n=1 Tax=Protopolystoma xenopodis TaxID=117903 RepID=A0A3S5B625_9PLAT|nr:unnamed protein product [Protopolystoma xenopodis]
MELWIRQILSPVNATLLFILDAGSFIIRIIDNAYLSGISASAYPGIKQIGLLGRTGLVPLHEEPCFSKVANQLLPIGRLLRGELLRYLNATQVDLDDVLRRAPVRQILAAQLAVGAQLQARSAVEDAEQSEVAWRPVFGPWITRSLFLGHCQTDGSGWRAGLESAFIRPETVFAAANLLVGLDARMMEVEALAVQRRLAEIRAGLMSKAKGLTTATKRGLEQANKWVNEEEETGEQRNEVVAGSRFLRWAIRTFVHAKLHVHYTIDWMITEILSFAYRGDQTETGETEKRAAGKHKDSPEKLTASCLSIFPVGDTPTRPNG